MKEVRNIVTSSLSNIEELVERGYVCVTVVGKVYDDIEGKEKLERISSLNVFRHYYHLRSKDYYACHYLYQNILEKKGIQKLLQEIDLLLKKHNTSKIALCDNSKDSEFGYRHILRHFLIENDIPVIDLDKIDLDAQKSYWYIDRYKDSGHYNLTDDFVGKTLEKYEWTFAKTMQNNPHFYLVRSKVSNNELFLQLVAHIRYFGKPEIYDGVLYRVFCYNGFKYWTMPQDLTNESCDLINKKVYKSNT